MIQLIRGFRDILPDESPVWQYIENTARRHFENFGFSEIRPPVLEQAELFQRSIGELTDIVEKEMYTFPGSKGNLLTLRPEATASVVRAYIQHRLYAVDPVRKLYTVGPMFRKERPQKGRYRQFYQINAEVFGIESPYMDAQLIYMVTTFFEKLNISGLSVHLNSLGCPECRPRFKAALSDLLASQTEHLCSDCVRRKDKNPLRVLDCKVPTCRHVMSDAPAMVDFLCDQCTDHFSIVKDALTARGVSYEIDRRLVRGLDYYTRTAFEVQTDELGTQNAVAGGGRYDGLVEALGGPSQPAVGFAIGMDRLVELAMTKRPVPDPVPDLFIAAMGKNAMAKAFDWACGLSAAGVKTEIDFTDRSLKALMRRAGKLGARHVMIVGDQELSENQVILRNMETKEQTGIPIDTLVETVRDRVCPQK